MTRLRTVVLTKNRKKTFFSDCKDSKSDALNSDEEEEDLIYDID